MKNICLIYNYAQHYRKNIFMLMDKELECDFVFGDKYLDVKKLDYALLTHFKKEVKNKTFIKPPLYYQKGVLSLLKEDYTHYIMLGEVICVSTWLMVWGARLRGKKIYLWSHGWYGKESRLRLFITKNFFQRFASGIFTYGNYARNLMIKGGLDATKLHVIYNSLDYDEQLKIRQTLQPSDIYKKHFQNNFPVIVFIGRLTKRKQLNMLIEVQRILDTQNRKINVVFVGSGEERNNLQTLAEKHNTIDRVWFYGASYNEEENAELLFNADLCVSPGNIGLTAIHCLMFGLPVISHDNFPTQMPEFEIIIEGKTGMFFKKKDVENLAEKVKAMLDLLQTNREEIRQNCYAEIDGNWNPHTQIELFKNVLKNG
jgi:glycosyltransferase involved in cell wall biosynthesis